MGKIITFGRNAAGLAMVAALVMSCSTTPKPVDVQAVCLPMAPYSLMDQQEFAAEVRALDPIKDKQVIRFLGDYAALRSADRACQSQPSTPG